jgi:radical SAM superfamily enzyme YgiQ (UPF0313 family)
MYYPYWLAHAAAVLDADGFDIHLWDCPAAGLCAPDLMRRLQRWHPDLCILETSTASSAHDCALASAIKEGVPGTRVCMVGTHVTALWQETLTRFPAIDFVGIGEYDYIVRDLARLLSEDCANAARPDRLQLIAALGFRDAGGQPQRGPIRPPIENVDELPWIAPIYKRFLDPRHYYFSLSDYPMVMLIGGRGCPAKCTYCVYPQVMHGHRYRTRSPESLVGEMKWVQDNMPEVREIVFEDDTFTGDRAFAKEVARLVKEKGVRLKWFANVRVNIDRETLAHMAEAGFRCCATGFESGDGLLLKNMWKGQSIEQAKRFVADARSLGILVHGCFMVGFPGETRETMAATLDLALELEPDSAQFYPVMPFPGTTYFKWAAEHDYLATQRFEDWLDAAGGHRCVLNLPGLRAEEIQQFCNHAYRRFLLRPRYLWHKLRQAFLHPQEGRRSLKALRHVLYDRWLRHRPPPAPFDAPALPVPSNWRSLHRMARGRMFEQSERLRSLVQGASAPVPLKELADQHPEL